MSVLSTKSSVVEISTFSQSLNLNIASCHIRRIQYPLILGTIVAFLTSVYLAVTFLPSITSTILQLRSGVIPTLKYNDFDKYRRAPDQVSILTGSMFWGCLISSVLVGGFFGLLLFLCLWQATVYFVQRIIAVFIGKRFRITRHHLGGFNLKPHSLTRFFPHENQAFWSLQLSALAS